MHERLTELPTRELIDRLATSAPIPGGGSAAALAGAMAAALVQMVVELTSGRPTAADHEAELAELRTEAAGLRSELLELTDADAAAYDAVIVARRMPRETEAERAARDAAVAEATHAATVAPLETARAASRVLDLARRVAPIGNRNAISDVGVAGLLAGTAVRGGALNVRINIPYLPAGDVLRDAAADEIERLAADLDRREAALREAVEARSG
jgi:formiminotetrahydrofolate cyclodeaminase